MKNGKGKRDKRIKIMRRLKKLGNLNFRKFIRNKLTKITSENKLLKRIKSNSKGRWNKSKGRGKAKSENNSKMLKK